MYLSIIIPTYNEEENIQRLIEYIQSSINSNNYEIIVVDAGSVDKTVSIASALRVKTFLSPVKGRAGQMNYGVEQAKGDVLYFVHADSLPTKTFYDDIEKAIQEGYNCGSFRFQFDSNKFMLKINAFFTRFNYLFFRGGDQTIFVTNELWTKVGPYKEEMLIMEDYDFLERIWKSGIFKLIPKTTTVSSRKYNQNSWIAVQLANLKIVKMYRKGASQEEMITAYKNLLNYRDNAF